MVNFGTVDPEEPYRQELLVATSSFFSDVFDVDESASTPLSLPPGGARERRSQGQQHAIHQSLPPDGAPTKSVFVSAPWLACEG